MQATTLKRTQDIPLVRAEFNIFGIKNDPQATTLIELFDYHAIEYKFFDFRDFPPTDEQLQRFADFLDEEYPLNQRSNLYKKNEKKFNCNERCYL